MIESYSILISLRADNGSKYKEKNARFLTIMAENRVQVSREQEAISRSAFARLADISYPTLKKIEEDGSDNVQQHIKNKIVRAFSNLSNRSRDYPHEYLFPDD